MYTKRCPTQKNYLHAYRRADFAVIYIEVVSDDGWTGVLYRLPDNSHGIRLHGSLQ